MALEVKKQEKETTQGLIRRFTTGMKQSGILIRARETKFRKRAKSRQMKKRSALRRVARRKEYEMLKKMGKTGN